MDLALLTPSQARYRLVLGFSQGETPPVLSEPARRFYAGAGSIRGLSEGGVSEEIALASLLYAISLSLPRDRLTLDAAHDVTLIGTPTHLRLVPKLFKAILAAKATRAERLRSWYRHLRFADRPWLVRDEPLRWVAIGFERTSPIVPEWVRPHLDG